MTGETVFKELSDAEFTRMRRGLLRTKGSDIQREFLTIVRDRDAFLGHFADIPTRGGMNAALTSNPLTEDEFKDPPTDTEQQLYSAWKKLSPATACRSTFWAQLTLEHIKNGHIDSVFLAANGGNLPGGAERIDFALKDTTDSAPRRVDACVRTVLRRLGGIPEVRGKRSVFVDCPLARAWWRERLVIQAAAGDSSLAAKIRDVLRISQTYWEKLVDRIVTRNPTFGSINTRNAFMRSLAEHLDANENSKLKTSEGVRRLCRRAAVYQGSRELSILSAAELDSLMNRIVRDA